MRRRALLLGLVTALATGCQDPATAAGGHCISEAAGMCVYIEATSDTIVAQATCIAILGPSFTFFEGAACPLDLSVGRCTLVEPDGTFLLHYYAPGFTEGAAATDCASRGGSFLPPPAPVPVR
jgi:hypothetical protein